MAARFSRAGYFALQKVWNAAGIVHRVIMAPRCDCKIAKVSHECVRFPSEQMLNFHLMEAHCVQGSTCSNSEGMTGPHLEFSAVCDGIEIEKFGGCFADACFDVGRCDVAYSAVAVSIQAQGEVGVGMGQFGMALQDLDEIVYETDRSVFGVANE